jgi:hypothetical protein
MATGCAHFLASVLMCFRNCRTKHAAAENDLLRVEQADEVGASGTPVFRGLVQNTSGHEVASSIRGKHIVRRQFASSFQRAAVVRHLRNQAGCHLRQTRTGGMILEVAARAVCRVKRTAERPPANRARAAVRATEDLPFRKNPGPDPSADREEDGVAATARRTLPDFPRNVRRAIAVHDHRNGRVGHGGLKFLAQRIRIPSRNVRRPDAARLWMGNARHTNPQRAQRQPFPGCRCNQATDLTNQKSAHRFAFATSQGPHAFYPRLPGASEKGGGQFRPS